VVTGTHKHGCPHLWFTKNGISINDELQNAEFVQANAELYFVCPYTFPRWCLKQQHKS
jgi:hypothetical protein